LSYYRKDIGTTSSNPKMFPSLLTLPAHSLGEGMVEFDGTGFRTHGNTAPSVPAFLWIEDDRRFSIFRIGNKEIHLAYIYTGVASVTNIRVKYHRASRSTPVRKSIHPFLHH